MTGDEDLTNDVEKFIKNRKKNNCDKGNCFLCNKQLQPNAIKIDMDGIEVNLCSKCEKDL